MSFLVSPPEVISALISSGAGSGPMFSAAAAWTGLAAELDSAADAFVSVTSGVAGHAWQGAASQAMAAAAVPYAGWLSAAAAHATGSAAQANVVAGVFESALAATVHPALVAANRYDLVSLVMSNLFGQNAPAIAVTEGLYEEMWAQDVAAMVAYHSGASAAAAELASMTTAILPNFGQNGAPPAAALPTDVLFSRAGIGYGNVGSLNFGLYNNGTANFGINNTGTANLGMGNVGTGNTGFFNRGNGNLGLPLGGSLPWLGVGNTGNFNQGLFNTGSYNIGIGLTGDHLTGIGPLHFDNNALPAAAEAVRNYGYGNIGHQNVGFFNTGRVNVGLFNTGDLNIGIGNTGSVNFGFGNTSPYFKVEPNFTTFGSYGVFNNGSELIGGWNTGFHNIGIGNVGTYNSGLPIAYLNALGVGNHGDFNSGFFNTGFHNQGLFNTGSYNVGIGLTGDHLIGIGPLNTSSR